MGGQTIAYLKGHFIHSETNTAFCPCHRAEQKQIQSNPIHLMSVSQRYSLIQSETLEAKSDTGYCGVNCVQDRTDTEQSEHRPMSCRHHPLLPRWGSKIMSWQPSRFKLTRKQPGASCLLVGVVRKANTSFCRSLHWYLKIISFLHLRKAQDPLRGWEKARKDKPARCSSSFSLLKWVASSYCASNHLSGSVIIR